MCAVCLSPLERELHEGDKVLDKAGQEEVTREGPLQGCRAYDRHKVASHGKSEKEHSRPREQPSQSSEAGMGSS